MARKARKTLAPRDNRDNRNNRDSRDDRPVWTPPAFEEIRVSAEATMYMGAWQDEDWM
jgi:coenzyme PQQ precursor peptide PqqA